MARTLNGERIERRFTRNGVNWRIEKSWHFLENGERYYYIHVYKGIGHRPARRWAWVTSPDGTELISML